MQPMISILICYKWDPTLFDGMVLPDAVIKEGVQVAPAIEKDDIIDLIIAECGELNLVWSDPNYLKSLIAKWSETNLHGWQRMYDALWDDYNALHNFDRNEVYKDVRTPDLENTYTDKNNAAQTDRNYQNGYNSGELVESSKTVSATDLVTNNKTTGTETNEHTGHLFGNIGVTKSQEMLEDEIKLRMARNIHDIIVNMFRDRFCILIY